ncbi:Multidrug/Oligosaccharidyl-lipid/Polysaccharide (MOP) Flippase Superfamily [Phytophthora infestans T30-4]|uniref:Multidrug/Oligosaccharidyl-lipid/Polysaccharide (MOP) Flippase Superfamily n=1 Tax=Phytophthora infestans (strain T30-4) TaxID=403677 RepID=D0NRQ4_PHYIT|nr:Multidrug/Oligosaccharidyl-lipid/Polysaccharide (MOP) Flippase Superfamily [Phytophthora infestans T30-4]EEY63404.1 Multidrug/Oligosaccharidyl-lipid/Polysaccharide (MOP) Flippase Superfamily [Phytophthora infestans T30-4]|eukprot:XP_002898289.1 Multidrug/Oligosaccharidyl-lipid/Polysaccharide (MOP) Flippase Superfamily [Phytophthora infestans T30-4]
MRGSLVSSALGPPPQIPRGPASRAPRAGLLRLRDLAPARLSWRHTAASPLPGSDKLSRQQRPSPLHLIMDSVGTTALEFLPGLTCIVLAGHMDSPYTQQYVDAATLSTMWWSGWNLKEALAHVGLFMRLGIPGCLMMTMEWVAFELLTLMAGVLPNAVVSMSAHSVLVSINSIIYMIFAGLAVAVNIRVGNCLGANLPELAKTSCTVSLTLTLAISLSFIAFLYATRWTLPSLLLNDHESIVWAASALAVWAPFEILDGQNTVLQGVFRGAGKQTVGATINAVVYYIFGTPLAALLGFY